MYDDMLDISSQMVLRWDRLGADHAIDCSDDFTRLAFDTIGLCSFGYRFNEFYTGKIRLLMITSETLLIILNYF